MNRKKMVKALDYLCRSVLLAGLMFTQGCVAEKQQSATVHQTLKGDNSTIEAMQGELELPETGFLTLSDLTDQFARDLEGAIGPCRIYLGRTNIRDARTRDVANFSIYLENELDASLSNVFQLVTDPGEADYLIGALFQEYGNTIKIFFKYRDQALSRRKSMDYSIERLRLPADSLKENLHSKAYKLAANIVPDSDHLMLYINPVNLDSCDCVTDFSRSFTTLVRTEIVRLYPDVQVCTEKPIKQADLRGIKNKAGEVKKLEAADAVFAGADTVFEGSYFVNGDTVMVNVLLKDLDGKVLNSASVDIDRGMIHSRLDNPVSEKLADKADKKSEKEISEKSDIIHITTTKGSGDPVYRGGENITFLMQAQKPLYFYLYDINSRDEVFLLYPYDKRQETAMIYPGTLRTVPEQADDFELEVIAPFGKDLVKVFASPVRLPIPELTEQLDSMSYRNRTTRTIGVKRLEIQQQLSQRRRINPDDLVDYYRGVASEFGIELYEDSLIVETAP